MRRTFDTPGAVALRVRIGAGLVAVDAGESGRTEVEVEPLRDDEVTLDAVSRMALEHVVHDGRHELRVELPEGKGGFLRRGPKVAVRVRCPAGAELDVQTSSGDVGATGRVGGVRVKTASGDVSLPDVDGSLDASTASGDIVADDVTGAVSLKSASGDLRVGRARGTLAAGAISGDISVGEALDTVTLSSVSGDIGLGAVQAGSVRLQSVSGDVEVGVRPGLRVWLDVSSVSGSTRSELDHDEAGEGSEAAAELHVRTISGDIRVARSAR